MKYQNTIGTSSDFDVFIVFIRYLFLFLICPVSLIKGAIIPTDDKEKTGLIYEIIPVRVMTDGYKTFYLDALYTNKKILYIDIVKLFSTLKIPCFSEQNGNSLTGFIESEDQTYLIDYEKGILKTGTRLTQTLTGLVKDKGVLYLESKLFTELFGITLNFNYRTLYIQLISKHELPLIKLQRIEKTRSNLSKLKGEVFADTVLKRNYHLLKFGALDWSISTNRSETGSGSNNLALAVGTEIFYGEADLQVNYYDRQKFDNRQLFYLWRWVDNDKPIIKQAQIGTISTQTISYINAPVVGFSIRNSPTTIRKSKGYYFIKEFTEPNWDVELYINNVLVDYTKADASGFYVFKVPIVYGYTTLKFKFYGSMGEERTSERIKNIPYTVMPAKEFEYGFSAGIVENNNTSRFARGELNYGVNRYFTIGGGAEHLSSITNGSNIPFLTATLQPFNNLTLNTEYAHGVRTKAHLNYYFKKDISLDLEYTNYVVGQRATIQNADEEVKARLSAPFSFKKLRGFARIDWTQLVYNSFKYNQTNIMFSVYYKLLSANSSTQVNWLKGRIPNITSDLNLLYRFGKGYTFRPSIQYNVYKNAVTMYNLTLEKYISKGDISIAYERIISSNTTIINLNFKYDLNFARTNVSVSQQKQRTEHSEKPEKASTVFSESVQGSLVFGRGNKYIYKSNNPSVGRGGISFYPFLDINQNGKFDKGESMVKLSTSRIMHSKIINEKDSILSIPDLMAFTWYTFEFKDTDLGNIAWRFKKKRYKIIIDPNQFKRVDVPIVPVYEIEEMAYLNCSSISIQHEFTIRSLKDGDMVDKIDFVMESIKEDNPSKVSISNVQIPMQYELKSYDINHLPNLYINKKLEMVIRDTVINLKRTLLYDVQLYTSHKQIKPEDLFTQLISKVPGIKVIEMTGKDGLYHYSTGVFLNPDEAYEYFHYIREKGWIFGYVSIYTGGKRKAITFNTAPTPRKQS